MLLKILIYFSSYKSFKFFSLLYGKDPVKNNELAVSITDWIIPDIVTLLLECNDVMGTS